MEGNVVMTLIIAFIAVAIMLSLGVTILGNTSTGFECGDLEGSDPDNDGDDVESEYVGWAKACADIQDQQQSSFNLLVVILIVIAAVAILVVVRMLY